MRARSDQGPCRYSDPLRDPQLKDSHAYHLALLLYRDYKPLEDSVKVHPDIVVTAGRNVTHSPRLMLLDDRVAEIADGTDVASFRYCCFCFGTVTGVSVAILPLPVRVPTNVKATSVCPSW